MRRKFNFLIFVGLAVMFFAETKSNAQTAIQPADYCRIYRVGGEYPKRWQGGKNFHPAPLKGHDFRGQIIFQKGIAPCVQTRTDRNTCVPWPKIAQERLAWELSFGAISELGTMIEFSGPKEHPELVKKTEKSGYYEMAIETSSGFGTVSGPAHPRKDFYDLIGYYSFEGEACDHMKVLKSKELTDRDPYTYAFVHLARQAGDLPSEPVVLDKP